MKPSRAAKPTKASGALWVVGEVFEDFVFSGLSELPSLGEELRVDRLERCFGGGAFITAVAAARLGLEVRLSARLPPGAGAFLAAEGIVYDDLRQEGEPSALTVILSAGHDRAMITHDPDRELLFQRLIEHNLPDRELLRGVAHCHLALSPSSPERWVPWLEALKVSKVSVSADFGWNDQLPKREGFEALSRSLDLLFLNRDEAMLYASASDFAAAERHWDAHPGLVIVTLGERGAMWLGREGRGESPGVSAKADDTTGAGDAFNAGFLAGRLNERPLAECVALGNRLGARSVTAPGGLGGLEGNLASIWEQAEDGHRA